MIYLKVWRAADAFLRVRFSRYRAYRQQALDISRRYLHFTSLRHHGPHSLKAIRSGDYLHGGHSSTLIAKRFHAIGDCDARDSPDIEDVALRAKDDILPHF